MIPWESSQIFSDTRVLTQIAAHNPRRSGLGGHVESLIRRRQHGVTVCHCWSSEGKNAIKRVVRFWGNLRMDMTVAHGDLVQTVIGGATEVLVTLD